MTCLLLMTSGLNNYLKTRNFGDLLNNLLNPTSHTFAILTHILLLSLSQKQGQN